MKKYAMAAQPQKKKIAGILSLLEGQEGARGFTPEQFETIANGEGVPTGKLQCLVDHDYVLVLNDYAETKFLSFITKTGFAQRVRGQTKRIDYVKPWATKSSPYYPDFIVYTNEGQIAFLEVKSILGMCQDENIVKYLTLRAYCLQHGYLCGFFDAELVPFRDYLLPPRELDEEIAASFYSTIEAVGGFTSMNLKALEAKYPHKKPSEIKRLVSSLILQDPHLTNRYTHDSPYEVNAVNSERPLPYKNW